MRCLTRVHVVLLLLAIPASLQGQVEPCLPYAVHGMPPGPVTALAQDARGFIWAGSTGGRLYRLDGRAVLVLRLGGCDRDDTVRALASDGNDLLFASTTAGMRCIQLGAHAADGEDAAISAALRGLPRSLTRIACPRPGRLYAETGESAWMYDVRSAALKTCGPRERRWLPPMEVPDTLRVYDVRRDCDGSLWAATDAGLLHHDHGRAVLLGSRNGLPESGVNCLLLDREGQVWCGTTAGLFRHSPGRLRYYAAGAGLPSAAGRVTCFAEYAGSVWLGTEGAGLVERGADGQLKRHPGTELPSRHVLSMHTWLRGTLTILTSAGLASPGAELPEGFRLPAPNVEHMAYSSSMRSMWFGTPDGLFRRPAEGLRRYGSEHGLPSEHVTCMTTDRYGDLWAGTGAGAVTVSHLSPEVAREVQGLHGVAVTTVFADRDGGIWFGSRSRGVFLYADGELRRFSPDHGFPAGRVHGIGQDNHGALYFSTDSGISMLPAASLRRALGSDSAALSPAGAYLNAIALQEAGFTPLDIAGGLPVRTAGATAIFRDGRGDMWFAVGGGAVCYTPEDPRPPGRWTPSRCGEGQAGTPALADVIVTGLHADGISLPLSRVVDVPAGGNSVTLRCLLPTFRNAGAPRYHFLLEGPETLRRSSGDGTLLIRTLPPGRYEVSVMVAVGEGILSAPTRLLSLNVSSPVYAAWWFGLLVLASVVLLLILLRRLRRGARTRT